MLVITMACFAPGVRGFRVGILASTRAQCVSSNDRIHFICEDRCRYLYNLTTYPAIVYFTSLIRVYYYLSISTLHRPFHSLPHSTYQHYSSSGVDNSRSVTILSSYVTPPCLFSLGTAAMSNRPIELCLELGYHDNIEGVPCRGPAKLLLDGLKSFAQSHAELHGPNILAMHYLHAPPYGLRHIPLVIAASQPGSVLMWERASDKMR
jgi:hypothetical protein